MATYKITRFYASDREPEVIATGLTITDAREHCWGPESSSETTRTVEGRNRTQLFGPWSDGYREEA